MRNELKIRICGLVLGLAWATTVGATVQLKEGLREALAGDYLVTLQERTATVLVVREKGEHQLVLEEITAPVTARGHRAWADWVRLGGPGHASWTAYLIDLNRGCLEKAYSYSRCGWIDVRGDQFLGTLLRLNFLPIGKVERRRIGPCPLAGPDRRKVWNPPLFVEGRRRSVHFKAYTAQWPRDGTTLAGRQVTLYRPEPGEDYPSYLPYWLEVSVALRDARLRAVDSGRALASPKTRLLTPR